MRVRKTVRMEVLRNGLKYRQLLSPATVYQALCGNHEAEPLRVPFEHSELLQRMKAFRYQSSTLEQQRHLLRRTGEDIAGMFQSQPGLIGEMAEDDDCRTTLTHLELVLSAAELSLIPFELAASPRGIPGAGQPMFLQAVAPMGITRGVRRVSGECVHWPGRPRILFAHASPPQVPRVPARAHLYELRRALDPWINVPMNDPGPQAEIEEGRSFDDYVVALPDASLDSIQEACSREHFTHVHILAHGVPITGTDEKGKFGLALSNRKKTDWEVVDGDRLADALRTHRVSTGELSSPTVVTLASCDSAQLGDVVTPGASLAHTLHEAGIPMVVASQFPLSIRGSVTLTGVLYRRLVQGDDPRVILHDVRQQLHQREPNRHDWASLVCYASFPSDFEQQLERVRSEQAIEALRISMAKAEGSEIVTLGHFFRAPERPWLQSHALAQIADAKDRLPPLSDGPADPAEIEREGVLGSMEKRRAWIHYREASRTSDVQAAQEQLDAERAALTRGMEHYRAAFDRCMNPSWAGVQYLSLAVVLNRDHEVPSEHWSLASATARLNSKAARQPDPRQRAWALADLLELTLLEAQRRPRRDLQRFREELQRHWESFLRVAGPSETSSTVRQLSRYAYWWWNVERATQLAESLLADNRERIVQILPHLRGVHDARSDQPE
jgi:hypothetical protein